MMFKTLLSNWSIISVSSILCSVLLLIASSTCTAVRELRVARQAQVLPIEPTTPSTECKNSVYSIGRYLQYHFICCDQTIGAATGTKQTCEQKPVVNFDCNPDSAFGTLNETFFNCNGTDGQRNARERCDSRWAWIAEDTCWMWTTCFAGACEQEELILGSSSEGFCGDGRCDHRENVDECAVDCCPHVNFECKVSNNTCPDACCGEPSCCMNLSFLVNNLWMYIIIGVVAFIVLANLICCCFCFCCYKGVNKCKRKGHSSSVPSNNMPL